MKTNLNVSSNGAELGPVLGTKIITMHPIVIGSSQESSTSLDCLAQDPRCDDHDRPQIAAEHSAVALVELVGSIDLVNSGDMGARSNSAECFCRCYWGSPQCRGGNHCQTASQW